MNSGPTSQLPPVCAIIVDDDPDCADSIGMLLEFAGVVVRVAYSAPECLALVEEHHPLVIVSDLDMPTMDGLDEARALRALPGGEGLCLIALTGNYLMEVRARNAGFDHFFVKPGNVDVLTALIQASCHAAEARCSPGHGNLVQ